ncbi:MAG TPA: hypothetical protein VFZ83_10425 [Acidimicrobiia bacterium]|nr:hypothetical protein [Acidimicrobiia bacterium]
MPQSPDWKQLLEVGMQFSELRRSQARAIASDLVAQGQLARDQLGAAVDELVEMSRRRTEALGELVAAEVQRQLKALGIATTADLDRLERKIASVSGSGAKARPTAKKAAAKKPAAKKTAKKAAAKKSAAKKSASRAGS